jgi:chromosome segregation ATPase
MIEKLKIPLLVVGIALLLVMTIQIRSCINENRIADISRLQGLYEGIKAQAEKEKEELKQQKSKVEEQVEILKQAIIGLEKREVELHMDIEQKASELKELKQKFSLINQSDKDAQILNLQAQVGNLEIQLKGALGGWSDAEARATGWKRAYELKDKYCQSLEEQLRKRDDLLRIGEELAMSKDKQIGRLKFGKTIERLVTWPLSAYAIFKIGQGVLK